MSCNKDLTARGWGEVRQCHAALQVIHDFVPVAGDRRHASSVWADQPDQEPHCSEEHPEACARVTTPEFLDPPKGGPKIFGVAE